MARVTQAAKVGIFVLLSAGATYFIYRTVSKEVGGGGGYTVWGYVRDATGLAKHTRVTIAGIPVGTIDDIRLVDDKARVDVKVGGATVLYQNGTMGKKAASLLGESVIVLTPGYPVDTLPYDGRLQDGDQIKTITEETSIGDVVASFKPIAESIAKVADQLAKSIGTEQGGADIRVILDNLAEATKGLNATIRENRTVLNESLKNIATITSEGRPELRAILENVKTVTEEVRALLSARSDTGQAGELRQTIDHLNHSAKTLESVMSNVDVVTGRVVKGEGTVGRISKDEKLINDVEGIAEGVGEYVGNITRLQTIVGLRADYNFLANTIKSYVELRLQPREDKYYLIQLINDPHGTTSISQSDVDTTNPQLPPHYRTITTTTTNGFLFSLEFAKRLGPFTGRFGIMESTGGIGLDLHLLQDRFELTQDLFGFGEELQPRWRVSLAYEFMKRFWLIGGVDASSRTRSATTSWASSSASPTRT